MKLTVFLDLSGGGIADYSHAQTTALAARGVDVKMLCPLEFTRERGGKYSTVPTLSDWRSIGSGLVGKPRRAMNLLRNFSVLAEFVSANPCDAVLIHFSEYLAPLWAPRMRQLHDRGVVFASVVHDPVRDYQIGPNIWHERSVRDAFSFLDLTLIHTLDPISTPGQSRVKWIPHGIYNFPEPTKSRSDVRRDLGVPMDATLAVSYGFIRDNKNLDLGIEAIARTPGVHLLVAGRDQGVRNKPVSYYQALAERLGCSARVHWLNRFISEIETADLLSAVDVLLLTYSRSFVSWSGVLSLAARYRLPAIVSAGTATLGTLVEKYRTGVCVQPDSVEAIQHGFAVWADYDGNRDWDGYLAEMSWDRNAELVEAYISELLDQR